MMMNSTAALLSPTPLTSTSSSSSFYMNQDMLTKEEISTIFVVGFPEDMQEREFQNMFMFSPGFEAATLKLPSKENEDDYITANNGGRKQIIGFAKFRSRKEALDARDILNGRKVDAEKGCMLKAEMAKKNLHTKRGLLNNNNEKGFSTNTGVTTAYDAFYSVPPPLTTPTNGIHPYSNNDMLLSPTTESSYPDFYSDLLMMGSPPPSSNVNSVFISRSHSVDARAMDLFVKPSMSTNRFNIGRFHSASFSSDGLDYLSKSTPSDHNSSFPLMNSFFNNNSNTNNINSNNINHNHSSNINNDNINNNKIASHPISPPLPPSTISTSLSRVIEESPFYKDSSSSSSSFRYPTTPISPLSSSPPLYRSLNGIMAGAGGSSNPADQNPPCNTLYVGNLPPNTNEEELRLMFSKCLGYKRLSFKNKANGPMCFVEFDDTAYAAQALQDLQGNPLSNSIKGGIRLSFSKNPLGVRQNPYSSNNNNNNMNFYNTNNNNNNSHNNMNFYNNSNNTFNGYRRESITTSGFDPQLS